MSEKQPEAYFDENREPQTRTEWIADRLLETYYVMNKPSPMPAALIIMASDVSELSDEQLVRGLSRLRKEREWVTVKAILELSGAAEEDGRPGVEAAWAMCPKTEEASVVWTKEMAHAFDLCRSLLQSGDEIAARMVFKEQYPGLVSAARVDHIPVRWIVSLGWDANDRVRALAEAVEKKRIPSTHAFGLLGPAGQDELLLALPAPERKLLTGEIKKNPVQLAGLEGMIQVMIENKVMPTPPLPRRAVEQTDEERAEHAKRVREQAAQLKQRTQQDPALRKVLPNLPTETADDAGRETVQCSSRARATREGAVAARPSARETVEERGAA